MVSVKVLLDFGSYFKVLDFKTQLKLFNSILNYSIVVDLLIGLFLTFIRKIQSKFINEVCGGKPIRARI